MRPGHICRLGAIAGRMACILAAALLACASSAHSQVIEKGGFPVKEDGLSGEPFSLSCPPRLYVAAGESVLFSCSATAVPEEGVRYEWESLSDDGLHLLSDANERSPLFTAPLSGEGAEYVYRLTAMSVGVYETAAVTVIVGGVLGGSVQDRSKSPVAQEGCDSLADFEGGGRGECLPWNKAPPQDPFGGIPEDEGIVPWPSFPGSPGAEEKEFPVSSGGNSAFQTPPYLDCPVAVFLEELETGVIECHVSDAAGEEFLEYSWESVGGTTRDYLENPKLIPEDAPDPSVVAPEAPVYETLESFRSGERTFRHRYRLTATSRATGLSSSSEVEVFVSGNRPSVYCPLEVVVEEGSAVAIDCEGVDPLSSRMDYDEDGASIWWEWEGLWGTSTEPLAAMDLSSALFTAPAGSAGKEYHYIASMTSSASGEPLTARRRVTVTVTGAEEGAQAAADASALANKGRAPVITCNDATLPDILPYGEEYKYKLDCSVTGDVPSDATYSWAGDELGRLTNTDTLIAMFDVPQLTTQTKAQLSRTYDYTVTLSAPGIDDVTEDVTITVQEKEVICWVDGTTKLDLYYVLTVDEGASDLELPTCTGGVTSAEGEPYTYHWRGTNREALRGAATLLTATDQPEVSFKPPSDLSRDTRYDIRFDVFRPSDRDNYDGTTFRITVENLDPVECNDPPGFVYEKSDPFAFNCTDKGTLSGVTWDWGPSDLLTYLTNTDRVSPTFTPPSISEPYTIITYTVRAKVNGVDMGGSEVTVRMRAKQYISVVCAHPGSVYEGSDDFVLDCSAAGELPGSRYNYVWTALGGTVVPGRLNSTTIAKPTFNVPENVNADTDYEYTLTVSGEDVHDHVSNVTVTVLNTPAIVITCPGNPYSEYEGEDDIVLDCSATGAPSGSEYDYVWTGRGSTVVPGKLSSTTIEQPEFDVPEEVAADETYEYTLAVSADNAEPAEKDVTVTIKNKSEITVTCTGNPYQAYEGADDIVLDCSALGAPSGSDYEYEWTARGGTSNTNKLIAGTDGPTPTFEVPDEVDSDETYEYTLTVSAEGAKDDVANVTVTVKNRLDITVTCLGNPYQPYEGSDNIVLDCSASGGPSGSTYDYVWTERGSTPDTDKLSGTTIAKPTFDVPESVNSDETYEYTLTVSADNAVDGVANVTVTVKNKPSITVACTGNPYEVYAGDDNIVLDCSALGAPEGSTYDYAWTPRGSTSNTDKLIAGTDGPTPTFEVPGSVDSNETYEYTLTVSADNTEDDVANVTVNVLKKVTLTLVCTSPPPVYEGSPDFDLNCSASGAPSGSDYEYEWTARGSTTNTAQLSETDGPTPTFNVPDNVNADTDYEYTLTVSARGADPETANVTVRVLNKPSLTLVCTPPAPVYEGAADFDLDCVASGAPSGSEYDYVWTGRGSTVVPGRLSGTTIVKPTFDVPDNVDADTDYEYTLTVSAENAEDASANVTVRVLNKPSLALVCTPPAPVYEGAADFALNCSASGAPSGSGYDFVWTTRGATTNTDLLISGTAGPTPTFDVPEEVESDETYEYTLTVSADNAESATEDVTVTVLNKKALDVACATPSPVYEGSADFALDCAATGAPAGSEYVYVWTGRGSTANTDPLISGTNGPTPTFDVPEEVDEDKTYEYLLTVSAENAIDATAEVTVKVLKLGSIALICASPPLVYEGSEDFELVCSVSGDADYTYEWTARGSTPNTAQLSAADIPSPTFDVPDALDETTTYEYLLTARAENVRDATAEVTVTVLNRGALAVACAPPPLVYEGAADFALDCSASGAPVGTGYEYVWTARGATANTDLLIAGTDGSTPTFDVPEALDATTTYEYLLTASAENAESGSAAVTVTVLNHGALRVVCADPPSVYEGSEDFDLDCSASGAPSGSEYAYVWTARGSTANTDLLMAGTDGPTPTFDVPDALDETTTYEYLLTASAENAESGSAEVTVTVLNTGSLRVVCASPVSVYEGSADFAFDCSVSGAPAGSDYAYVWTARGSTANTDLLTDKTLLTPTFLVPDDLPATTTYEYLLTVSAENAEDATAEVTVTVLNRGALSVICADPPSIYEGSEDFALDCSASGASSYTYAWTARGSTANTAQLSAADILSPTFYVPEELDATTTYEYLLTVSSDNTISGTAEVSVTVLNRGPLSVVCTYPGSIYEGSADFELDCSASGAPTGSNYTYVWTARGSTANTDQLSAIDIVSPTFYVPDEVDVTTGHEYLLTASAENAVDGTVEVTVTVLNRGPLSVVCTYPGSIYEGSADFELDCSASGAPTGSNYTYVWTARGSTANTDQLSAADISSPTFYVPEEVDENGETYEYLLTVSADNAEDASAEMTVNVLDGLPLAFVDDSISGRVYVFTVGETITDILLPEATGGRPPYTYTLEPVLPLGLSLKVDGDPTRTISGTPLEVSPGTEYTWQVVDAKAETVQIAFFIEVAPAPEPPSPPVAESLSLGVTVSASPLRFGVQSADTEVSLDPMTDQLSTYISGPYHGGRMTLSLDGSEALDENGEMDLSIELASPVVLRREGGIEDALIVLSPSWSLAESCEQLSSQTIGSLYTEVTLSDADCRLLLFGGELDLTDVPSGRYTGSMDLILRSGESEETHSVEVDVTVVPVQWVITIGPGGVRFSTSREIPAGLTEEQNLSIYPHIAFLTEEKPHGVFELSNPSLIPLEVSVSARFGYTEATENGREVVVEDVSESHLGDLSQVVDIHPGVLVLQPGEKSLIRYGVKEGALAAIPERGYATFFDVVSSPRQYVRSDRMPEEVAGERTARVTMRVPGVYVPKEGASRLRAALLSISYVGSLSATFLVETLDHPFVGEVVAYDGDGRELGRRETLVYTRSRVRIPLDRMPEEGAVFLRFSPRGSGRVPEPASVEWDAPRRDIGDAEDKDRATTTETLARKP